MPRNFLVLSAVSIIIFILSIVFLNGTITAGADSSSVVQAQYPTTAALPTVMPTVQDVLLSQVFTPVPKPSPTTSAKTVTVYNHTLKKTVKMNLDDYLIGVVAAETWASFDNEAIKAQAVAARTYLEYHISHGGCSRGGDICTDSGHCQAYQTTTQMKDNWGSDFDKYYEKIRSAVTATQNEILTYNEKPICALYHSASVGSTEDCADVFGESLPYLISVDTPTDKPAAELTTTVELTAAEFVKKINSAYPTAQLSAPLSGKIKISTITRGGKVKTLKIGQATVNATSLRTTLGLKSTNFTFTASENKITFSVLGSGHGVGMSQRGSQALAQNGKGYKEILLYYYTGAVISKR